MPLHRTILYQSDLLTLRHVGCCPTDKRPGEVEHAEEDSIILPLRGAFIQHFSPREQVLAEPNQALLFAAGRPFRISHPVAGDDCLAVQPSPAVWHEVLRATVGADGLGSRGLGTHGLLTAPAMAARHLLWRRLEHGLADPLEAEESGLALVAGALHAARRARREDRPRRRAERSRRSEQVEAARIALLTEPEKRWTLGDLARRVYSSPYHLAHAFREEVGVPVHQYQQRTRIARAVDLLLETDRDLTAIALDLGFASHSHFTSVFRRMTGAPPSSFRTKSRKILIAPAAASR
jgi:AraC family transcriptional regulator